jgi:mevalonate kinase
MEEYFSYGKILLTGEYLVLNGAQSIALPVKLGQTLKISPAGKNQIHWNSIYQGKSVFKGEFAKENFRPLESTNNTISSYISNLLSKAFSIKEQHNTKGWNFSSILEFPLQWGLGSSSTLINNISKWLKINPFKLNKSITGGSGYDIACADSINPIVYEYKNDSPSFREIEWEPDFKDRIFFVYTGKKQDSAKEVNAFKKNQAGFSEHFIQLEKINKRIINSTKLADFEEALSEHEEKLAKILNKKKAREEYFIEFPGTVKHLGAWGGDFILVTWEDSKNELKRYLERRNMNIIYSWDELIKTEKR